MNIQIPPRIQTAFDQFRNTGSFGPAADHTSMDMVSFVSFRDNTELVQNLVKLDGTPSDLDGKNDDHIQCGKDALASLDKSHLQVLEAELGGDAKAPEMVIHTSGVDGEGRTHESYQLFTGFQPMASPNTPVIFHTMLTAIVDPDGTSVGSNVIQVADGKPKLDESGMETFANEFMVLRP